MRRFLDRRPRQDCIEIPRARRIDGIAKAPEGACRGTPRQQPCLHSQKRRRETPAYLKTNLFSGVLTIKTEEPPGFAGGRRFGLP